MARIFSVIPSERTTSAAFVSNSERYERHELLGRGGMASVYAATDRTNQRRVALKQLEIIPDAVKQQRHLELFEREFLTLAQLVHPRIVRAFDFGVDAGGAYYAMELLQGGDLQGLAPLPWRQACAVARDVCSALALLHSRRFVHRDISPRNVRCLENGTAKLIDFGAMGRIGPTKMLVGTPPCCAPESVSFQSIDGRTDLFALGATLYYVLVGKHAYPAHTFAALPEYWRAGFSRPSELVSDIPAELDALVLDLLRVEPDARPSSATEVMERLSAIDGQDADEELRVASAYLATPVLVGRDAALERVRRRLRRPPGPRSRSILIEGDAGVGRTRFLDACSLDATLVGQVVVRADSDDADSGAYGVVRTLARQLLNQLPQLARDTAAPVHDRLVGLIPELASETQPAAATSAGERGELQRALHAWWTELSKQRPFVIAVDDFHRIDEPSASLIALLEQDTNHELCVMLTVDARAQWTAEPARRLLQPLTTLRLEPLSAEDSERLLQSVFGTVPHLELLAHRLNALCAGSPRDLLQLAQHLVDRGVVRYASGTWTLPAVVDAADLPSNMYDALQARVARLPEQARQLAQVLALCPNDRFASDDLGELAGVTDPLRCLAAIEALIAAQIAKRADDARIKLSQAYWAPAVRASLSRAHERSLERRLAEALERSEDGEFRAVQHWFRAEDPERALDLLVAHAQRSIEVTARGAEVFMRYILALPEGWFETFQQAARACDALGRPPRDKHTVVSRLLGITGILNAYDPEILHEVFATLQRLSGYDDWHRLDPQMDPKERLMTALALAQARYEASPERDRVVDVKTAIRDLSRAVVGAVGAASFALDIEAIRRMPKLAIFSALSPALDVSSKLVDGVEARFSGRVPRALRAYAELLELASRPDRASLDKSHAEYLVFGVSNALGLIEAGMGLDTCLAWADKIATQPAYEVNATLIRMVHCLYRGDVLGAEERKRIAERLRIQNTARQLYEGGHLIPALNAHALSGDLTRVRHVRDEIAPFAKRFAQWVPVLRYATAEYHRMTRDYARAALELDQALDSVQAGTHFIWPYAAAAHLFVLADLGEHERARAAAQSYSAAAERELEYVPDQLQLGAALAHAYAGEREAGATVDALIARLQADEIRGLYLGVAHEVRARIALHQDDMAAFARHAELCGHHFLAHKNTALTAKYHRLLNEGRRRIGAQTERSGVTPDSAASYGGTRVELALVGCQSGDQRARLALTLLARQSGAVAGALFMLSDEEPVCVAAVGDVPEPSQLVPQVNAYLAQQLDADGLTATQSEAELGETIHWKDDSGREWTTLLIGHHSGKQFLITGVAVFALAAGRSFVRPAETAAAISRVYADNGATSLIMAAV